MNFGECYYDYFAAYLRDPVAREVFEQHARQLSIQILAYHNVFDGCRCFCSLGLSHYTKQVDNVAEVLLPVDDGWQDVSYVLANALFFIVQNAISLRRGTSITGISHISPALATTFGKDALYFATPYGLPEAFNRVTCGKKIGAIYLACFISTQEANFLQKHGVAEFEDMLEARDVDISNLERASSV